MKKLALLLVSVAMLCSLVACGGSDSKSKGNEGGNETVTSAPADTQTPAADVKLGDEVVAIGKSSIGLKVPTNFAYNDGWSCYSDTEYKTAIWLADAQVYEKLEEVDRGITNFNAEYKEEKIGNFSVKIVETPDGFYGAMSNYYITFDQPIGGFAGCRILISNNDKDMAATQADIIKEMLASICVK